MTVRVLFFFLNWSPHPRHLHSFPTRRSSDLTVCADRPPGSFHRDGVPDSYRWKRSGPPLLAGLPPSRSEEHTSELQSRPHLVCRLLLEKKKNTANQSQACNTHTNPWHTVPAA